MIFTLSLSCSLSFSLRLKKKKKTCRNSCPTKNYYSIFSFNLSSKSEPFLVLACKNTGKDGTINLCIDKEGNSDCKWTDMNKISWQTCFYCSLIASFVMLYLCVGCSVMMNVMLYENMLSQKLMFTELFSRKKDVGCPDILIRNSSKNKETIT